MPRTLKNTLATLALTVPLAVPLAVPLPAQAISSTDLELCNQVHGLATTVMRARQGGVAMPSMMRAADSVPLAREVVRKAFDYPRYSSPSYQRRAVVDFANDSYQACLKVFESRE